MLVDFDEASLMNQRWWRGITIQIVHW